MQANPYQPLVSLLSNVIEAYTTAFFVFDRKTGRLNLAAFQSLSSHLFADFSVPLEQSGILSRVHKVGQPVHIPKLQDGTLTVRTTLPFYREGESHIKGIFAIPVGDGAGVLYVDTKYGWGFNDKQQKWIQEIGSLLLQLMQRQDYQAQQIILGEILQFWNRLDDCVGRGQTIVDLCRLWVEECAAILEADFGFLALRELGSNYFGILAASSGVPQSLTNELYLIKQGIAGRVLQRGKELFIGKLNPHAGDHFLFSPSESLPHHGTLWILPADTASGHTLGLIFLTRTVREWGVEIQRAIKNALRYIGVYFDQASLKEELQGLQTYDLSTDLLNAVTFETKTVELLMAAMQTSLPLTISFIQFEPWHLLLSNFPAKVIRQGQKELAVTLMEHSPPDSFLGQVSENRIGFLYPQTSVQVVDNLLRKLMLRGKETLEKFFRGIRINTYSGAAGYPQDGTRAEDLLMLAYRRLFNPGHSKTDK